MSTATISKTSGGSTSPLSESAAAAFPCQTIAPATDRLRRRSEASVVGLSDGTCLAAYGNHTGIHDNASGHIAGRRLTAQGKPIGEEWGLVETPPGSLNVMSPALRRLPDGRLGMLHSHRASVTEAMRCFRSSDDDGLTWSEPTVVGSGGYVTGCHDRFTILESGRLIAPLHATHDWNSHYLHVRVAWSDDAGESWSVGRALTLPRVETQPNQWLDTGCLEPAVVERRDGSLLMTTRTAMGTQFFSESFDGGETWSALRSMEVSSPSAPAHLSRFPGSDTLLLLWTPTFNAQEHHLGPRRTIMSCVSHDGGRSWPRMARKVLIHDPVRPVDYPTVFYRDGEVWITLRVSGGPNPLEGGVSTVLMRVPREWFFTREDDAWELAQEL